MNRVDLIKEDTITFSFHAIELAKNILTSKILELQALGGNDAVIQGLQFVVNKLDELRTQLKTSNLLMKAQGEEKISITDIDAIVHKNGRIIAGFEQKSRQDAIYLSYIPVNASQYITLRDFKQKLGIERFYYLYHLPKNRYLVLPLKEGWKFGKLGNGHSRATYALAPKDDARYLTEKELIEFFREIIREA
jgi:hypothetical protein